MSTAESGSTKNESKPQPHPLSPQIKNHHNLSPPLTSKYPPIPLQSINEISPEQNSKNFRTRMLSPQTPKQKIDAMLEKMELNTKYFPSKAHVCKGESSDKINFFSPQHSNSPIVNYYAGVSNSNPGSVLAYYSPDQDYQYKLGQTSDIPFYQCQVNNFGMNNQNYNFSPSAIFNKGTARHYSNSSIGTQGNNTTQNDVPLVNKTLQEKIEGNFNEGTKNSLANSPIPPSIGPQSIKSNHSVNTSTHPDKTGGDEDSEENQELYMLSFNSDDTNEFDDAEEVDNEEGNNKSKEDIKKGGEYKLSISEEGDTISNDFLSSGINNKFQQHTQNNVKPPITQNQTQIAPNEKVTPQETFTNPIPSLPQTNATRPNEKGINEPVPQEHVINYYSNYINNYYYNNISQIPPYIPSRMNKNINQPIPFQPSTKPRTITASNLITTTTANNKKIKRIDPQTYLDETYEYLAHNIFPLAKDQAGCRFLQKKLEDEPEVATSFFYPVILPYILPLVKEPFGNYLIQKICYTCTPDQIMQILKILSTNILDIGSNSHGTRVIQHIINFLRTPELINYFISIVQPYVIPLLKELNGTHIIQKFNSDYPKYAHLINQIVIDNCESLATHRHGCCVLQKYLDCKDEGMKSRLIKSLIDKCLVLIIDQFGNYEIQSVLLLDDVEDSNAIASKLVDNAAYYSKHKYSSNVVEKCFDFCDENARKKLIAVLSKPEIMNDLILDEHGNYVIQKVLACADTKTQNEMLTNIAPIINKLKNVNFGERIISRLLISYPQMTNILNGKEGKRSNNKGRYNNKKKNNTGNTNNKQKYK